MTIGHPLLTVPKMNVHINDLRPFNTLCFLQQQPMYTQRNCENDRHVSKISKCQHV